MEDQINDRRTLHAGPLHEINNNLLSDKRLNTKAAADYLGFSTSKLEKQRLKNEGPVFFQERKGGMVYYRLADLDQYINQMRKNAKE